MTRSELVEVLACRFPQLVRADADVAVAEILGAIGQTLAQGHRVEIRGFGSFSLNYRPPRIGRNPKTGEKVGFPTFCNSTINSFVRALASHNAA